MFKPQRSLIRAINEESRGMMSCIPDMLRLQCHAYVEWSRCRPWVGQAGRTGHDGLPNRKRLLVSTTLDCPDTLEILCGGCSSPLHLYTLHTLQAHIPHPVFPVYLVCSTVKVLCINNLFVESYPCPLVLVYLTVSCHVKWHDGIALHPRRNYLSGTFEDSIKLKQAEQSVIVNNRLTSAGSIM